MTGPRRNRNPTLGRSSRFPTEPALSMTADVNRGSSNLATTPRAGNISSDTRAGLPG